MANIFNNQYCHFLQSLSKTFTKIKVPVYVIACGAQAKNYDDLATLVHEIGDLSKQFIDSIYRTGGQFALRGYFTKAFFDQLGYPSAVVTGCPSMYQLGRNFVATSCLPHNTSPSNPVFNGNISLLEKILTHYPKSIYIDQDVFWRSLYSPHATNPTFYEEFTFFCNFDSYCAKLLGENRVRIIPDVYNWTTFLKQSKFDYSFGSRIHGNIAAILSGIPTTVVAIDTRTQEMAEFFNIPYVKHIPGHRYTAQEFHDFYNQTDYTNFNRGYSERYKQYEQFLVEHGIVSRANQNNSFLDSSNTYYPPPTPFNQDYYSALYNNLERDKLILTGGKSWLN